MRSKLLQSNDEIVKCQHDAAYPRDGGEFVQHSGDRGVGPDENTHARRQLFLPGPRQTTLRGKGVLAGVVAGLGIAPSKRLEIDARLVMIPFPHRCGVQQSRQKSLNRFGASAV
jgi:hypothetical protein